MARRPDPVPPQAQGFAESLRRRLGRQPRPGEGQWVLAAYALVTVGLVLAPFASTEAPDPKGQQAPLFTLPTSTGGSYSLSSDLGTRPIMVEFMHPDCSHCEAMGGPLRDAYAAYGARVVFLSVAIPLGSFDDPTAAMTEAFRTDHNHPWTYCVAPDPQVSLAYGVSGTPTFFFIHTNGTIAAKQAGELPPQLLAQNLQAIAGG
jgi:peroxiredoxin